MCSIAEFKFINKEIPVQMFACGFCEFCLIFECLLGYNLTSLIKEATCFLSNTFETGLSHPHKLISTAAKSGSFKGRPQEKNYKSYTGVEGGAGGGGGVGHI